MSATLPAFRARLDTDAGRRMALLVTVAVAIRLALMPFTLHFDAYQIYSRAHEAAYLNEWFGFTSQIIIQTFHNVWLLLMRPFLPDSGGIWSDTASVIGVGASREDYERFLAYDHLYRAIFLMKLPYVVADLACAWVITRLVPPARRLGAAAFWLLNPLVIFSTAIYGRHDSLAILLVLLSIVAARRATDGWRIGGLALLGVATLTRFFPIIIVPAYLLAYRRSNRQLGLFVGLLAGMAALVELAGLATSGRSTILTILGSYEHFEYWFDAGLYLRFDDFIFLFPVAYVLGLLWVSERGLTPREYPVFGAAAFLLLFSLTFFHPHYAIWLVPFLALVMPFTARMLTLHAIQVACVLVYSAQWGSWTTWELLEPLLGDRVASLPDPVEAIGGQIEPRLFFGFFRSILTAVSLWMIWALLRDPVPPAPLPDAERGEMSSGAGPRSFPHTATPLQASNHHPLRRLTSPLSRWRRGAVGVGLALLLTGCSARVTGFDSPVMHDHGPVEWAQVGGPVQQSFVAGPGYAAAMANDGRITTEDYQQRHAALPDDAREGALVDLRIGLRLEPEAQGAWDTAATVQIVPAPQHDVLNPGHPLYDSPSPIYEAPVDALPRDGDWLLIDDPPELPSGLVFAVRVVPGDGPDAGALRVGLTPGRVPYGGWRAVDASGADLNGAMLVRTRYDRDVEAWGVVSSGAARLRDAARADTAFMALWALCLGGLCVAGARLRRPRTTEET
ncbi:MAG TPA: hypothetical protein VMM78_12985 [Thermomicrobiales bacterium]|nr:hypothetical protein [Thermomicrobiales bacterium]